MISDVPSQLSHNEVVEKVQLAIQTREWKGKTSKPKDLKTSILHPGSMHNCHSPCRRSPSSVDTIKRSVVIKLSLSCVRDSVISRASRLVKTDAQAVFSTGETSRIFIQSL